jgi:hypothetical protein
MDAFRPHTTPTAAPAVICTAPAPIWDTAGCSHRPRRRRLPSPHQRRSARQIALPDRARMARSARPAASAAKTVITSRGAPPDYALDTSSARTHTLPPSSPGCHCTLVASPPLGAGTT